MFLPLPPPPAGRVRAPLYRVAELGSGRRHGGDRGGGIMGMGCEAALPPGTARHGAARRGSPLPVPLLRLDDVHLRSGKGRAARCSLRPRWCRWGRRRRGGHDGDGRGRQRKAGRQAEGRSLGRSGRLVLHRLAPL